MLGSQLATIKYTYTHDIGRAAQLATIEYNHHDIGQAARSSS